ncbi:Nucleolar GTP-binding protein 1 [Caligus rogercresseyi]|uniref:Nucleolar GTP-binding protein 1 n=1 Tax=Caligus rogercresseyi TaxID=217165 RepID=A0A7T8JYZ2_CALRO|nr:Nucleolar GTP-binding protein 1 [Caligus rogercresseyi]
MAKLDELEKEEEAREKAGFYASDEEEEENEGMEEIRELAGKIRVKKKLMKNDQRIDNTTKSIMPRNTIAKKRERSVSRLRKEFTDLGVDMTGTDDANFTKTKIGLAAAHVSREHEWMRAERCVAPVLCLAHNLAYEMPLKSPRSKG